MAQKQRVIFRADGNSQIGLGHVIRSLAMAQMLRNEYECIFAIQAPDPALKKHILEVCQGIIILPSCAATEDRFIHELEAYLSDEEIVVLDGYSFNTAYQQCIKAKGATLVCIDDVHSCHFLADVVLNPAGGVSASNYSTEPYTKLYIGPSYALLRQPFLQASISESNRHLEPLHLLLCMGGADPKNHTLSIAKELQKQMPEAILEIVTGSAYVHQDDLNLWLSNNSSHSLNANLDAASMYELMSKCQVAVTSASGVAYEYTAVGGALFIVQTAANQQLLYDYLLSSGMAKAYKAFAEETTTASILSLSNELRENQKKVFDGKSGDRIKEIFEQLTLQTNLRLRQVIPEDRLLLYDWANDPEVRKHSFNSAAIPLAIHDSWFTSKFSSPKSLLYIAEVNHKPAAHIRFELSDHSATINYLIGSEFRGKGLGHTVLLKGIGQLEKDRKDIQKVEGLVQHTNPASIRAFEKAGFQKTTPEAAHPEAVKFTRQLHTF